MVAYLVGAIGFLLSVVVALVQRGKIAKLEKSKEELELLTKLQRLQNKGLKEAKDFAAEELRRRNEELAKQNPAAASDSFFADGLPQKPDR